MAESHPVRDIVIPLTVVLGLLGNALLVGIAWGRNSERMDTYEATQTRHDGRLEALEKQGQSNRDRIHDLERDANQDRIDFRKLEDYTRGRIDRLPYRAPSASPRN